MVFIHLFLFYYDLDIRVCTKTYCVLYKTVPLFLNAFKKTEYQNVPFFILNPEVNENFVLGFTVATYNEDTNTPLLHSPLHTFLFYIKVENCYEFIILLNTPSMDALWLMTTHVI